MGRFSMIILEWNPAPPYKRQPKSFSLVFITTNHFLSLEECISVFLGIFLKNVFLGIVDPCFSIAIK
jgi:hypothetical protein